MLTLLLFGIFNAEDNMDIISVVRPENWTEKTWQFALALLGVAQVGGGPCSLVTVDLKGP